MQIDTKTIKLFSLIHCPGTDIDKAKILYGLMKNADLENDEDIKITAWDKDIIPVFDKLCKLATIDIFQLAQ